MSWKFRSRKAVPQKGLTDQQLQMLLSLIDERSRPNINALTQIARDVHPLALNIKQLGYDLARRLASEVPPPVGTAASPVALGSKLSTQADLESDWLAHWCAELRVPLIFHRKLWEFAYVLQAIHSGGMLRAGMRGLGFGCGEEPIPSYLAAHGVAITATDLPPADAEVRRWADTGQHTASVEQAFQAHLVDRPSFDRLVGFRNVDMNAIPADLEGFDFCWSICALEHVGSIAQGLAFIENALATLKPGGIAVHTTEFNIRANGPTIDNWLTVLFQRHHFEELAERLAAQGHEVAALDFDLGDGPMDRFVDLPPWGYELTDDMNRWLGQPAHLKLAIDGFVATCFGIVIRKRGAA